MISAVCTAAKAQPLRAVAYATLATGVLMIADRFFNEGTNAVPTLGKGFFADCQRTYTGHAFLMTALGSLTFGAVCAGKFAWSQISR